MGRKGSPVLYFAGWVAYLVLNPIRWVIYFVSIVICGVIAGLRCDSGAEWWDYALLTMVGMLTGIAWLILIRHPLRALSTNRPWRWLALGTLLPAVMFFTIEAKKSVRICLPADDPRVLSNVGMLRQAVSIYYGDNSGRYPASLADLTLGAKYLAVIPTALHRQGYPPHRESAKVRYYPAFPGRGGPASQDLSGWGYVNDPASPDYGTVWIDCTHTNRDGREWTSY